MTMPGLATGSVPAAVRERAVLQPHEKAFTFVDYNGNPDGVKETLTWSQLHHRACHVAAELRRHGAVGDRAAIVGHAGDQRGARDLMPIELGDPPIGERLGGPGRVPPEPRERRVAAERREERRRKEMTVRVVDHLVLQTKTIRGFRGFKD